MAAIHYRENLKALDFITTCASFIFCIWAAMELWDGDGTARQTNGLWVFICKKIIRFGKKIAAAETRNAQFLQVAIVTAA